MSPIRTIDAEDREPVVRRVSYVLVVTLLLGALLAAGCAARGTRILLLNQGEGPVTQVTITWDGGSQTFDVVAPRTSVTVQMSQVKTNGFKIELTLPDGRKVQKDVPTTFDPEYDGAVTIIVEKDGRVGWQEHFERRQR